MKTNGTEQQTQIEVHTTIVISLLRKEPKIDTGKKKTVTSTDGAGKTGYLYIEDWK
jgi:hypothetical protein